MSLRNIGIVYRKELIDSLRDRRTVISMIVVPLLVMPLITIGMGVLSLTLVGLAMKEIPKVMILGGDDSPRVMAELEQLKDLQIVPAKPDFAEEISNKQIRAAVKIPEGFDAKLAAGESSTVNIYMYEGELKSGFGADRLQQFFRELRDRTIREHLEARQLPASLVRPFDIEEKNVAPPEKVGGAILGGLVPYFVILLCLTGAMYPAMDLTAGEKERGTIETILCSPVSRTHLVLGKIPDGAHGFDRDGGSGDHVHGGFLWRGKENASRHHQRHGGCGFANHHHRESHGVHILRHTPARRILFRGPAGPFSFAKSFKEAQSYISPLMIVVVLPAVAALLPGVELNPALALVPVLNTSLVSKEIITGTYHWNLIALIFLSSSVYAGVALAIAVKLFQREDVLFRT